nr:hypothetical transcript [Hymenolepis microstoma]
MALAQRVDTFKQKGISETHRQGCSGNLITCFVTQLDNIVLRIDVDTKANGQEVLNKVCTLLGIQDEADYFGLQYALSKGDLIWLNMRNRLSRQVPGNPPFNLFFKVKYFVPPYNLVLEETKHQFYLNTLQQLKLGLWDAETSLELQSRLIALMTYVQFGSFNACTTPCKYACFWSDHRAEVPHEVLSIAANYHKQLTGMSVRSAEYELLRIAHEEVPAFGVYFYKILDMFGQRLLMGVGPEYVALCQLDSTFIERFPYCRLKTVTIAGRVVTLNLLEDDGSVKMRNYELSSKRSADCLYRSITELHCFFRCDNVRDDVLNRTNPSFSIFDHNGGREYTFDVRYTSREVHDRARRNLYHAATEASSNSMPAMGGASQPLIGSIPHTGSEGHAGNASTSSLNRTSHSNSLVSMEEEVQELVHRCRREEIKCRVCLDRLMNNVFVPCGHLSCEECGLRLTHCHICRKPIEIRQRCYFPWEEDLEDEARFHGDQHPDPTPSKPQPGSSAPTTISTAAPALSTASTDNPDGPTVVSAVCKPQRSVAFNINESLESDEDSRAGESSSEEGMESGEAMHPGAFDFFHRHRRRFKRESQNSASTSSVVSTPMDRTPSA